MFSAVLKPEQCSNNKSGNSLATASVPSMKPKLVENVMSKPCEAKLRTTRSASASETFSATAVTRSAPSRFEAANLRPSSWRKDQPASPGEVR